MYLIRFITLNFFKWFKKPLEQNRILTPSEIQAIFINIEEIIPVNTKLFK
jgi:hypothetical protein